MSNRVNESMFTKTAPDSGPWTCGWQIFAEGEHWPCPKKAEWFLNKPMWLDQWNEVLDKYTAKHKRTILIQIHSVGFCERHAIVFAEWKGSMEAMVDER